MAVSVALTQLGSNYRPRATSVTVWADSAGALNCIAPASQTSTRYNIDPQQSAALSYTVAFQYYPSPHPSVPGKIIPESAGPCG